MEEEWLCDICQSPPSAHLGDCQEMMIERERREKENHKMKILIVYELIPDETRTYLCDVSDKDWSWIKLAHNNLINSTALEAKAPSVREACLKLDAWLNKQTPLDLSKGPIPITGFDFFVHSGFIL
jgi:hypothetical protein